MSKSTSFSNPTCEYIHQAIQFPQVWVNIYLPSVSKTCPKPPGQENTSTTRTKSIFQHLPAAMVALRLWPCLRFLGLALLGSNLAPVLRLDWPQLHHDIRAHASTLFDALFKPSYTPLDSFDDSIETSDDPFSSFPAAHVARAEVGRCFNLTSPALNHYQVLDLPIDAPHELIKPAYKKLVRVCHPDKLKAAVVSSEAASENYARLRLAYDVLKS